MMAGKISGTRIVAMRKDFFLTRIKNSRWMINQTLFMCVMIKCYAISLKELVTLPANVFSKHHRLHLLPG